MGLYAYASRSGPPSPHVEDVENVEDDVRPNGAETTLMAQMAVLAALAVASGLHLTAKPPGSVIEMVETREMIVARATLERSGPG